VLKDTFNPSQLGVSVLKEDARQPFMQHADLFLESMSDDHVAVKIDLISRTLSIASGEIQ